MSSRIKGAYTRTIETVSTRYFLVAGIDFQALKNVSMDVARMLLLDYETLAKTDVPEYSLEEFRANEVRDVHVFIRRGPEQAAFDLKEIRDITEMEDVTVIVGSYRMSTASICPPLR